MLRMGPKSAGRSASGPKSSILVTSLPIPPPLVVASARCLPVRAASSAAATDSDGRPCVLCRRRRRRICSCRRVQQSPRLFTGWRLPKDGGFSPHPACLHRTARPPRRDEHGEGRKEGGARREAMGGFYFLFTFTFYCGDAAKPGAPQSTPTTPPHTSSRAPSSNSQLLVYP